MADAAGTAPTWLITGMSGAGKATALRALEAAGVIGVDNLPVTLVGAFAAAHHRHPAAAVVDARAGEEIASLERLDGIRVVFLDAADPVLVRRLADSARPHPCASAGAGQAAVTAERELLIPLRAAADVVIDTGGLSDSELGARICEVVIPEEGRAATFQCTVSSFGFKYGPPIEADWVIDSRILPNPFWVPELRPQTGLDEPVREYLLGQQATMELIDRVVTLLHWAIDHARERGRAATHVAVGCTGGRHRSVVVATEVARRLATEGTSVDVRHRDVQRPDPR